MTTKIVHVAQSAGGVAEYLYMLLKNKRENNIENILIVSEDYKNHAKRFEELGIQIFYIPMQREISLKSDINAIFKLRKLINKIKPNIVYLHSSKAGAIGRIALFFRKKIKIIYNAHGWYFNADIGKKAKLYATIEKLLAIRANKIVNISKAEYDSALERKIAPRNKMITISNGIDFSKFENSSISIEKIRKSYNIKDTDKVIGVVGRLSEQKNPIATINAFAEICKEQDNLFCMFIGSGELEEDVKKIAKENNIEDKIIITGWVNDTQNYIPALDIAVLPSKWEGFGLVILEYIACRKPIIATRVGGIENIIKDAKFAILIKPKEQKELVEAMQNMLENTKKYTNEVELEYEKYKKKYSIHNVVKAHEKLFNELINKKV